MPEREQERRIHRLWSGAILFVIVLGIIFPAGGALAVDASTVLNYFLVVIANLLDWIINALGSLLIMIVDLIIQVAQFNTFTKAAPVQAGWPLVRDITNMFFIVILLVTAFSTIVRWSKFQYKQILPKMLLMAVLINFSLPLLGLCIDFSQVLMLTFVNAFKAAAGGNFVAALKLDKIMQLRSDQTYLQQLQSSTNTQLHELLGAEILAILIMGLSTTIVAIMLVYLIARIVGLWLALIMSPAAFLLTAMPSTVTSKISGVADDYWSKFGSLLSGGPIMAFYLWLTLATVQNGGFNSLVVQNYAGSGEANQVQAYFATAIGSIDQFGTYLVALTMMFMGVSAGVGWSGKISQSVGSVAGKIRNAGVGASKFLAYGGLASGGAILARGAGRGAMGVGNAVDRRTNFTTKFGKGMQRFGAATGISGIAAAGAYVGATRKRAVERHAERLEKNTDKLSPAEKLAIFEKRARRGNADEKKAAQQKIIKNAFTKSGMDYFEGKLANDPVVKELKKRADDKKDPKGAEDAKLTLQAYTKKKRDDELRSKLSEYEKTVKGNADEEDWIREKIREKMPVYFEDVVKSTTAEMGKDQLSFKKTRQDQFEDGSYVTGVMAGADNFFNGNEIDKDSILGKAMSGNSVRAKIMREHAQRLVEAARADEDPTMTAEKILKSPELLKKHGFIGGRYEEKAGARNGYAFISFDDLEHARADAAANPAPAGNAGPAAVAAAGGSAGRNPRPGRGGGIPRDEQAIRGAREMIAEQERLIDSARLGMAPESVAARNARLRPGWKPGSERDTNPEIARARERIYNMRREMVDVGASFDEAYALDHDSFRSREDREQFGEHVGRIHEEARNDVNAYRKADFEILNRNPNGINEVRETFVEHTDVNDLRNAFEHAEQSKNNDVMQNIASMVHAIEAEGAHIESLIDRHNERVEVSNRAYTKQVGQNNVDPAHLEKPVDKERIVELAKAPPMGNVENSLREALKGSNFVMNTADLGALRKRHEVETDRVLSTLKQVASSRTAKAVGTSGGAGGSAAQAAATAATAAANAAQQAAQATSQAAQNQSTPPRRGRRNGRNPGNP